jgi:hypothetical protein
MKHKPLSFVDFAALYESVSRMPRAINDAEFMRAVQANTPASVRELGRQVSVTLSIWVNADGTVRSVSAIVPELPPGINVRGIKLDERGQYLGEMLPAVVDEECMAAAEEAARVLRFSPAEKDGEPVEFPDLRIGVGFSGMRPPVDLRRKG